MNRKTVKRIQKLIRLAAKASPGPWTVQPYSDDMQQQGNRWVAGPETPGGYNDVCDVLTAASRGAKETAANAKLNAAAPEMAAILAKLLADEKTT